MKRLAYVGLKTDGERAFHERTGIVWMPGSEHDVKDEDAALMVKHTDVWKEVPAQAPALASVPAPKQEPASALPEWVRKGVELGANDDQLEAIAQAGGPDSDAGAALWKEATGVEWNTAAEPAPQPKPAAKKAAAKTTRKAK